MSRDVTHSAAFAVVQWLDVCQCLVRVLLLLYRNGKIFFEENRGFQKMGREEVGKGRKKWEGR